mgnify:CR=1 FL=1
MLRILLKIDRATMAYSLEARVPMLDHRIVEFAYSLPSDIKLQNGKKSVLKDILYKQVPKELVNRPKKGFGIPDNTRNFGEIMAHMVRMKPGQFYHRFLEVSVYLC